MKSNQYRRIRILLVSGLIVMRHRTEDKRGRTGGKMLFDCPGCLYQGLVTNLPLTQKPLAVWRE